MNTEEWKQIDRKLASVLVGKINALHEMDLFDSESTRLQEKNLSFYGDYRLLEATEFASFPPMTMRFLLRGGEIIKLDGTRDALETICKKATMNLSSKNVVEYAKFFLSSIMTEEGSFRLVENLEDIDFSKDPSEEEIEKLEKSFKPVEIKETSEGFNVDATMLYSDCVYRAKLSVAKDGKLDIEEEEVLLTEMPTRQILLK